MATIKSKAALQAVKTSTHKINNADWQDFVESAVLKLSSTGYANPAMLGSGTASSVTYLRGDGVWAEVEAGTTLDVSAFIETLLDDSDAATARATLGLGTISTLDSSLFVVKTSTVADGASAVAHYLDTSAGYVTAGAKLLSLRNAGVEKFSVGYDGQTQAYTFAASLYLWSNGGVYGQVFNAPNRTVVASAPMFEGAQTWNNGLTTFKALTIDVTDTASASGSLLADFMVGGVSKFAIGKGTASGVTLTFASSGGPFYIRTDGNGAYFYGNHAVVMNGVAAGRDVGGTDPRLVVTGESGQTAHLQTWRDSNYNVLSCVTAAGGLVLGSPTAGARRLVVGDAADALNNGIQIRNNQGSWYIDNRTSDGRLAFSIGGSDLFTVLSGGNVGIGTTSPDFNLHVAGTSATIGAGGEGVGYVQMTAGDGTHPGYLSFSTPSGTRLGYIGYITDLLHFSCDVGRFNFDSGARTTSNPFTVQQEWDAAGVTFTGFVSSITDTASASGSLLMDLQVGGVSKFKVNKHGTMSFTLGDTPEIRTIDYGSAWGIGVGNYNTMNFYVGGAIRAQLYGNLGDARYDGLTLLSNSASFRVGDSADTWLARGDAASKWLINGTSGTASLAFGGLTASYPMLVRYANGFNVRNADDSGNGFITANGCWIGYHANKIEAPVVGFYTDSVDNTATFLQADAAGILAQRNGTNAQAFRVYNTISGSDYDAGVVGWYANTYFVIGTPEFMGIRGGSGSARAVWVASNAAIYFSTNSDSGGNWQIGNDHVFAPMDAFDIGRTANRVAAYYGGGNTVTASAPVLNLTQTWNNGAVTFTGILANFTDTASALGSLLMDLQVDGASKFRVRKDGVTSVDYLIAGGYVASNAILGTSDSAFFSLGAVNDVVLARDAADVLALRRTTNAQEFRVYGTTTGSKYLSLSHNGSYGQVNATAATDLYLSTSAGGFFLSGSHFFPNSNGAQWVGLSTNRVAAFFGGGNTVTASAPVIDLAQTWNAGGVTFTGILANFTDTASASGSLLMDLQVGGTSKFSVGKTSVVHRVPLVDSSGVGIIFPYGEGISNAVFGSTGTNTWFRTGNGFLYFCSNNATLAQMRSDFGLRLASTYNLGWSATADTDIAADVILARDAAGILAQRNGTNAQIFKTYETFTDTGNYSRGVMGFDGVTSVFKIGTERAGTGSVRPIYFMVGGSNVWSFSAGGHLLALSDNTYDIGASGATRPRDLYLGGTIRQVGALYTAVVYASYSLNVSGVTTAVSLPTLNLSQTWNNAAVDFVGILADFTSTASGAGSLLMDLRVGGSSMFKVSKAGNATLAASLFLAGGIYHSSYGSLAWMSDGVIRLTDNAGTSFTRLCFGGTSASEPALGRNAAYLQAILADSSAYTQIRLAAVLDLNGDQVIGTRGAAVADATGAGDIVAQFNTLLARCRAHGLIAT